MGVFEFEKGTSGTQLIVEGEDTSAGMCCPKELTLVRFYSMT